MNPRKEKEFLEGYADAVSKQEELHNANNREAALSVHMQYGGWSRSPGSCWSSHYGALGKYQAGFFNKLKLASSPKEGAYHWCSKPDLYSDKQPSPEEIRKCKDAVFEDYLSCESEAYRQYRSIKNRM